MTVPIGHGPDAFGNALRHVRRTYLLSQRALATRLGVPHSRISRLEGGHHGITLESAISLYRALGFSIGLFHLFPCPESDEVKPRCHDWEDDGAVGLVDAALRAFPAHAAVGPGVPTWWGVRHGWGASDREDLWWFRNYRSPPVLAARQDGRMSDSDGAGETSEISPRASEAAAAYAAVRPEVEAATALFVDMVTGLLDDAGINYLSVSGRTKSVASFASKAERRDDGGLLYPTRSPTSPTRSASASSPTSTTTSPPSPSCWPRSSPSSTTATWASRPHEPDASATPAATCSSPSTRAAPCPRPTSRCAGAARPCRSARCCSTRGPSSSTTSATRAPCPRSTRTTSTAASPWPPGSSSSPTGSSRPSATGCRWRCRRVPPDPDEQDPRISAQDLAKFLASKYAGAGWARTDHYTWVSGLLLELGITSVDALAEVIAPVDGADLIERMGYKYPPGAVRRLDDALLATFGTRYLDLEGNAHRRASLEARLGRLAAG